MQELITNGTFEQKKQLALVGSNFGGTIKDVGFWGNDVPSVLKAIGLLLGGVTSL